VRWLLLFLLLHLPVTAMASDYVVVISRESPLNSLDRRTLKNVFLRKRSFGQDVRLFPVNVLGEDVARMSFEKLILGMDREELNRYWIKGHFQGLSPPPTQASFRSVKAFVERVSGAIGYLPTSMVGEDLKVLYEF
jgi:hypothetical protein